LGGRRGGARHVQGRAVAGPPGDEARRARGAVGGLRQQEWRRQKEQCRSQQAEGEGQDQVHAQKAAKGETPEEPGNGFSRFHGRAWLKVQLHSLGTEAKTRKGCGNFAGSWTRQSAKVEFQEAKCERAARERGLWNVGGIADDCIRLDKRRPNGAAAVFIYMPRGIRGYLATSERARTARESGSKNARAMVGASCSEQGRSWSKGWRRLGRRKSQRGMGEAARPALPNGTVHGEESRRPASRRERWGWAHPSPRPSPR
jgi:hypothetical protein